ncbi:MAG: HPr family phosphocarrier protein [Planctomycetota bacterium]
MRPAGGGESLESAVVVRNKSGLHARPASLLAEASLKYPETAISIRRGDLEVDAKSIMELLLLEAGCGTQLVVRARGPRAQEAVRAIQELFERAFGLDI